MGVMIIFSLSHYRVKSVECTDQILGEWAYNVVAIIKVALDDTFHFLDGRCFHNEQGATKLLLGAGENRFRCESRPNDL